MQKLAKAQQRTALTTAAGIAATREDTLARLHGSTVVASVNVTECDVVYRAFAFAVLCLAFPSLALP